MSNIVERVGTALYGSENWRAVRFDLDVTARTFRRLLQGDVHRGGPVARQLETLLRDRQTKIDRILEELSVDDA